MENHLSWRKNFFSSTYRLYSNGIQAGYLKIGIWSRISYAELNNKSYTFVTAGFFNRETAIIDSKNNQEVAKIQYNKWRSKASVLVSDRSTCTWEYTNFWRTSWMLKKDLYSINYHGREFNGEIASYISDEYLILAGLFIANFFRRRKAAAAS